MTPKITAFPPENYLCSFDLDVNYMHMCDCPDDWMKMSTHGWPKIYSLQQLNDWRSNLTILNVNTGKQEEWWMQLTPDVGSKSYKDFAGLLFDRWKSCVAILWNNSIVAVQNILCILKYYSIYKSFKEITRIHSVINFRFQLLINSTSQVSI